MRGDGKSNIYCGNCFTLDSIKQDNHKPTIAFLNPPYDVGTTGQMQFIEHVLDMVSAQNGTTVAIVQMSCGIKNEKELIAIKKRILDRYHLKAVLSMPDDLFYPVGVVTCIMVFETGKNNKGRETWFGYFKNDKFEKRKNQGRIDARGHYDDEKSRWLNAYHNLKEIAGLSVKPIDIEPNPANSLSIAGSGSVLTTFFHDYEYYSGRDVYIARPKQELSKEQMLYYSYVIEQNKYRYNYGRQANKTLKNILVPDINELSDYVNNVSLSDYDFKNQPVLNKTIELNTQNWKWFKYNEIFDIKKGFYNKKPIENLKGEIPLMLIRYT
jgi:type I restriction-modification system DNA methylase subunit